MAERAFRIHGGLWGSIAAGAMLAAWRSCPGRLRHDRKARSEFGMDDRTIGRALRDTWGAFRSEPCPIPPVRFGALAADGTLPLTCPAQRR